jgi:hypothetical protein
MRQPKGFLGSQSGSLLALVLAVSLGISGCIENPFREEIKSNWTIEEARQWDEYPLFWLGQKYEGFPLTAIRREPVIELIYGTGVYHDSTSWSAPIAIRIEPQCSSPPEHSYWERYYVPPEGYTVFKTHIAGLDAYLVSDGGKNETLFFWTGGAVVIMNSDREELNVHQIAKDLIPITQESATGSGPLPTPIPTQCFIP